MTPLVVVVVDKDEGVLAVCHSPSVVHHASQVAKVFDAFFNFLTVAELSHASQAIIFVHLVGGGGREEGRGRQICTPC